MKSNYKVSGKKLTKKERNCEPQMNREHLKSWGVKSRDLNHNKPSQRRYKLAWQKAEHGIDAVGSFERLVHREWSEMMCDWADSAMGG